MWVREIRYEGTDIPTKADKFLYEDERNMLFRNVGTFCQVAR